MKIKPEYFAGLGSCGNTAAAAERITNTEWITQQTALDQLLAALLDNDHKVHVIDDIDYVIDALNIFRANIKADRSQS